MSRAGNAKRGIVSGVINNILRLFFPFVSRTIILYVLGVAYLGIGGLFTSLLQVLNISELGFGTALSFLLYKPIAENDTEKICAILSFARKCFRYIGTIVLALGLMVLPFIKSIISGDTPADTNIYILYVLYLLHSVLSYFLFSYKRLLLSATQRYDLETAIASGVLIFQYVLQIIVLLIWKNFYLYVVVLLLSSVVSNLLCEYVTRKKFPDYVCKGMITSEDISQVKRTVKGVFITKIGLVMFSSVNNIVISAIFGLVILGQYTNYYYVFSCILGFFAVVHNSLRPVLGNCVFTESKEKMFDYLTNVSFIYNWAAAFCTCCLLCLYQDFIMIWTGEDNMFSCSFVVLISTLFYVGRIGSMPMVFVEAAGLYYESKYVNLIAGVVNLILNITLSMAIGIEGVVIATIISTVLIHMGGYILVLFKNFFREKKMAIDYCRRLLLYSSIQVVLITVVWLISNNINVETIPMLIIKAIAVAVLFIMAFFSRGLVMKDSFIKSISYARTIIKH